MQILATMPLHNGVICVNWLTIESKDTFTGNGHFLLFKLKYWLLYRSVYIYTSFDKRQRYIFPITRETQIWAQCKVKKPSTLPFRTVTFLYKFWNKMHRIHSKAKGSKILKWLHSRYYVLGCFVHKARKSCVLYFIRIKGTCFKAFFLWKDRLPAIAYYSLLWSINEETCAIFNSNRYGEAVPLHQVFLTHKGFRLPHLAGSASPSQGPHTFAMLHYWPI